MKQGGCFIKLDDPKEIEAVLKIRGVSKCRDQNEDSYRRCWNMDFGGKVD